MDSTQNALSKMTAAGEASPGSKGIQSNPLFRRFMFLLRIITQLRSWYILRELNSLLGGSSAVSMLDAGCGYGEYSYFVGASRPMISVTSLEMDSKLAAEFREFAERSGMGNIRVVAGDVLGLTEREAYDFILCGSVLEHIEEDQQALSNLVAALRPGGKMLVYVPTAPRRVTPYYGRLEERANRRSGGSQYGHVRDYTGAEIEEKLTRSGLVLRKTVTTYGFWGALAFEILYTFLPHSSRFSLKHWFILPPYFVFLHPFVMVMMLMDLLKRNSWGNGFMGLAVKPGPGSPAAAGG